MQDNQKSNQNSSRTSGSVVIRIEDILAGASIQDLTNMADIAGGFYYDKFNERVQNLYKRLAELPWFGDTAEFQVYKNIIDNLNRKLTDFTDRDKEEIFGLYNDLVTTKYGPIEGHKKLWIAEKFTINEVMSDCGILESVINTLLQNMPMPEQFEIQKKIHYLEDEMQKIIKNTGISYAFAVDREVFFVKFKEIEKVLQDIKSFGYVIDLVIDNDGKTIQSGALTKEAFKERVPYFLTKDELCKIEDIKNKRLVADIYFSEFFEEKLLPITRSDIWSCGEVVDTNVRIHKLAEILKEMKLSPCELIYSINFYIYDFNYTGCATPDEKTSTFLYYWQSTLGNAESRNKNLTANGKGFVCTGFASWVKAVIDAYRDKNIKASVVPINFYDKNTGNRKFAKTHSSVVLYLNDEKYGKKGYSYYDPTWAANGSLDFVFTPIEDLEKFKNYNIDVLGQDMSKIAKYLYFPRHECFDKTKKQSFPKHIIDNQINLDLDTIHTIIKNTQTKIQNSKDYSKFNFWYLAPEKLANNLISYTVQDINMFDCEEAISAYYAEIREMLKNDIEKYPDWKNNWRLYTKGYDYEKHHD